MAPTPTVPSPVADDFGSAPPAFGDAPAETPAPAAVDSDRPLRRPRK